MAAPKKRKTKDPTNPKIKNAARLTETKEERWLRLYPGDSFEIITHDPSYNWHCRACDSWHKCIQVGDIKKHLKSKKHGPNLKKWKENDKGQKQRLLGTEWRAASVMQQDLFKGFIFASILSHMTGAGAVRFNNIFLRRVVVLKHTQKLPTDASSFSKCVCLVRNILNCWIKQKVDQYQPQKNSYTVQLDEGSDECKKGVWAPLLSFSASMKPIAVDCVFVDTSSNSSGAATIINKAKEANGLGREQFRYFLSFVLFLIYDILCM